MLKILLSLFLTTVAVILTYIFEYNNINKIIILSNWILLGGINFKLKKQDLFSIENLYYVVISLFVYFVYLLDDGYIYYSKYIYEYKSLINIRILFVITSYTYLVLNLSGVLINFKIRTKKIYFNYSIIKIIWIISLLSFLTLNYKIFGSYNRTYYEVNQMVTTKNIIAGVFLWINLLVSTLLGIKKNKMFFFIMPIAMIYYVAFGKRMDILFILIITTFFANKLGKLKIKKILIMLPTLFILFIFMQSYRQTKELTLKKIEIRYDTLDFNLLAIEDRKREPNRNTGALFNSLVSFIPRKIYNNKPLADGKLLMIEAINENKENFQNIGSSAIELGTQFYYSYGYCGLIVILMISLLLRIIYNTLANDPIESYFTIMYLLIYLNLFSVFRGDYTSQMTKLFLSVLIFILLYLFSAGIYMVASVIIKNIRNDNNE